MFERSASLSGSFQDENVSAGRYAQMGASIFSVHIMSGARHHGHQKVGKQGPNLVMINVQFLKRAL
jgi:hypothetical protein